MAGAAGAPIGSLTMPSVGPVSVVVPCYNNSIYVSEAISSILAQSVPPAEIIVVDDGSTDDSLSRIARFGGAVTLLRQANRGAAGARNAGVAATSQPFIAFLDADDAWPENRLAAMLALLAGTGADLVFGLVRQCLGVVGPNAPLHGDVMPGRLAGSVVVQRRFFDRVGPFDEGLRSAEMIDWLSRAQALGMVEGSVPDVVCQSARKRDPFWGEIGVEKGPPSDAGMMAA